MNKLKIINHQNLQLWQVNFPVASKLSKNSQQNINEGFPTSSMALPYIK